MADQNNFVQVQDLFLAGTGASATATSLILSSFAYPDGTLVVMADFGSTGYGTFEPGTEREENFSFTGITQNANGTATLTGVTRGLKFKTPYDQDTALRIQHAGATRVVISNSAPFYNELSGKDNDETISGTWTFTSPNYPRMDSVAVAPTADAQFSTKKYVDDAITGGVGTASTTNYGTVKVSSAPATPGQPTALNNEEVSATSAANKVVKANASGKIVAGWGGAASTIATLDGSSLVVENPANATATPTASKIPIANGSGKLDSGWITTTQVEGGSGADGALTISSGTTTIDLGSATRVVKNYTSISITGTGALAFSNPATTGTDIVFYCQGAVTITSSATPNIDLRSLGGAGGAGGGARVNLNANGLTGVSGSIGNIFPPLMYVTNDTKGYLGTEGSGGEGTGGSAGAAPTTWFEPYSTEVRQLVLGLMLKGFCGAGGGGGGSAHVGAAGSVPAGGTGGRGAGSLIILASGAINFTGTINASGAAGGSPIATTGNGGGSGASGGGAGGFVAIIGASITANSGTINVTGGAGGNGGNCGGSGGSNEGGGGAGQGGSNLFYSGGAGGRGGRDLNTVPPLDGTIGGGTYPGAAGLKGTGSSGTFGSGATAGAGGGGGGGASGFSVVTA